tara:strand:+ start:416 stop:1315 length:900 start_codon:yes stop_codon:yes gene_type:complete
MSKNLIIKDLKKVNIFNKSHLDLIQTKTRNGKVDVFFDKKNKFFFLGKILTSHKSYYEKKYYKNPYNKKKWNINFYNENITVSKVDNDKKKVKDYKKFIYKKNVLDFGCGFGNFAKETSKISKNTYVYEKSKMCKKFIKEKIKSITLLENLQNYDNFFESIFLIQTLHYLPDQIDKLSNFKNKLKKKGKIILEIPSANDILLSKFKLKEFKDFTFCIENLIWHNKFTISKFLKKAGFKNIKVYSKQRHNLNNHLGWLMYGKPGGHDYLKSFCNKKQIITYEKFLKKNDYSDTLVAIAEK